MVVAICRDGWVFTLCDWRGIVVKDRQATSDLGLAKGDCGRRRQYAEQGVARKGAMMEMIKKGVEALERLSIRTLMIVLVVLMGIGLVPALVMSGIFA
jgi:hypothetical protein